MNSNYIDTYPETKETVRRFLALSRKESTGKEHRKIWFKRALIMNLYLDNNINAVEYRCRMEKVNTEWNFISYTNNIINNRAVNENKQNDKKHATRARLKNKLRNREI